MKNKSWIVLVPFLLAATSVVAEESDSYLCVAEESTGFYFENGKWGRAKFNVSANKFIISKLKK